MRRAALAALAVLALVPATAGATTTVTYSSATGLLLQGDAAGDVTAVVVAPDRFTVNGLSAGVVVPGSGCEQHNSIEVRCAYGSNRFVTANLGDGDDEFRLLSFAFTAPSDSLVNAGAGNDTLKGGMGLDSFDAGPGNDIFPNASATDAVNDLFEGGDGHDLFQADHGGTDTIRGGAGNDRLVALGETLASPSADLFDGGSGADVADYAGRTGAVLLSSGPGALAAPNDGLPGEGDDLDSVETLIGGAGGDTLDVRTPLLGGTRAVTAPHTLTGREGQDTLRVVRDVPSNLDGGAGSDTVIGGSAVDVIFSREGEPDTITCGGALDTLRPDLRDVPVSADCENLVQSDRREGPNVAFRTRLARVDGDGALSVRLACPRSVRIGCRGRLSARLDRRGTRFGPRESYSLNAGRSTTLQIELPVAQVAAARRRGARVRVRSVERGVHGPKTTQRSLAARRR